MYRQLHEITEADMFTKNYGAKQALLTVKSDVENGWGIALGKKE
jgi:hypothetical protein